MMFIETEDLQDVRIIKKTFPLTPFVFVMVPSWFLWSHGLGHESKKSVLKTALILLSVLFASALHRSFDTGIEIAFLELNSF